MNYSETLKYIHETPKFSRLLGNEMLGNLLSKLGNPQRELSFVHIAGTNGKGSASIMLAEILSLAGYKTGLFTSPYIERFNERIKINGAEIADDILAKYATHVRDTIERYGVPVSEFALDTAIALEYFRDMNCDIVVLETGLGGRLDATNVIDKSLVTVLMSIGFDHMQYLGDTIEKIASEKCGIIKTGGKVVVYPIQESAALSVIETFCAEKNAELIYAKPPIKIDNTNNSFEYDGKRFKLGLNGEFQAYNAAAVIETVKTLQKQGFKIGLSNIKNGLQQAFNPARFETTSCGLIIDGAHNVPAVRALCSALSALNKKIWLCTAMMDDKDVEGCIAELSKIAEGAVVTEIDMPRCASAKRLYDEFGKNGTYAETEKDPVAAVKRTLALAGKDGSACACGSLYFAGKIRAAFKCNQYQM